MQTVINYLEQYQSPFATEIYTHSLHAALPISCPRRPSCGAGRGSRAAVAGGWPRDRKSTRLNSSHVKISYAVFCLKKKKTWNLHRNQPHPELGSPAERWQTCSNKHLSTPCNNL